MNLNEYLLNKDTWGKEQFALVGNSDVIAQVACKILNDDMWVGWSLKPNLCGHGIGELFIKKCIDELTKLKGYKGEYIFIKVLDWNKRVIKSYKKAGFKYHKSLVREEDNKLRKI